MVLRDPKCGRQNVGHPQTTIVRTLIRDQGCGIHRYFLGAFIYLQVLFHNSLFSVKRPLHDKLKVGIVELANSKKRWRTRVFTLMSNTFWLQTVTWTSSFPILVVYIYRIILQKRWAWVKVYKQDISEDNKLYCNYQLSPFEPSFFKF